MRGSTEQITNKIIMEFAKTIEMFGLTPVEARLFVYLYLQETPQTLDDMGEALGKSKTSMSTSIRSLSDANLVTRVWRKGVRKDLYEANNQLFKTFMNNYVNRWIEASSHQKDSLETIQRELDQNNGENTLEIVNSLNDIIDFHKQVETSFRHLADES
ncbi:GbsR/MarR family transcriptional regulator [Lentibacillus cibarius]|uniref:HTH-type transcriptional regulator n=1 Tax=Lentibacillus cibarius TaxID=2583219 RepID=A0A5S3QMR3_9BACI|nr:MarR family transcriptional regulator [Lentibacillus cibarius]TMN23027.1 transcriptional regulator [Lentibacillus cibarius]